MSDSEPRGSGQEERRGLLWSLNGSGLRIDSPWGEVWGGVGSCDIASRRYQQTGETIMRPGYALPALAIFILLTLSCSPPVLGQCTDRDQDGFYLESGCGSALDCNDDDGSSRPDAIEVCDGRDNDGASRGRGARRSTPGTREPSGSHRSSRRASRLPRNSLSCSPSLMRAAARVILHVTKVSPLRGNS